MRTTKTFATITAAIALLAVAAFSAYTAEGPTCVQILFTTCGSPNGCQSCPVSGGLAPFCGASGSVNISGTMCYSASGLTNASPGMTSSSIHSLYQQVMCETDITWQDYSDLFCSGTPTGGGTIGTMWQSNNVYSPIDPVTYCRKSLKAQSRIF